MMLRGKKSAHVPVGKAALWEKHHLIILWASSSTETEEQHEHDVPSRFCTPTVGKGLLARWNWLFLIHSAKQVHYFQESFDAQVGSRFLPWGYLSGCSSPGRLIASENLEVRA